MSFLGEKKNQIFILGSPFVLHRAKSKWGKRPPGPHGKNPHQQEGGIGKVSFYETTVNLKQKKPLKAEQSGSGPSVMKKVNRKRKHLHVDVSPGREPRALSSPDYMVTPLTLYGHAFKERHTLLLVKTSIFTSLVNWASGYKVCSQL